MGKVCCNNWRDFNKSRTKPQSGVGAGGGAGVLAIQANRSTGCAVRSTPDAHVVQYSATKWPKQQTAIIYHILWLRCGNKIANKRHNSFDSATESECECECERAAAAEAAPGARYTAEAWVCFAYIRGCATCIPRTQTQRYYTALPYSVVVLCVCACVRLSLGG